jgi:hypothetical protein
LQINYFPVKKRPNSRQIINKNIENTYGTIKEIPEERTNEKIHLWKEVAQKTKRRKEECLVNRFIIKKSSKYIHSKKKSNSEVKNAKLYSKSKKSRNKVSRKDLQSSNFGSYSSKYTNSTNTKKLEKLGRQLFKKNNSKKQTKKSIKKHTKKINRKIMNPYLTNSNNPNTHQRTKSDHGKNKDSLKKKNKNMFKKTDPSIKNQKNTKNYLFPYSNPKQTTSSLNITQQDSDNLMESIIDSLENTYSKDRFQNRYKMIVKSDIQKKKIRFRPNTNPNSPKNMKVKIKQKRFSTHNKNKKKRTKGVNLYSALSKKSKIKKKQTRFSGPSQKKKILTKGQNNYMDLLEKKKLTLTRKKSPKINHYQAINLKTNRR